MDRQMDRQTDGQTDRWTERQTRGQYKGTTQGDNTVSFNGAVSELDMWESELYVAIATCMFSPSSCLV